ncbi:PDZ domain-containing protein [Paenibacillus lactis]|uniref:PDZ domain-containing protein n=1 Tax=Paenibacillus lactis TaxID=228574 RepID=UPI0036AB6E48
MLEGGDIIISADNKQIRQYDELEGIVTAMQPGEEITLEFIRDGQRQQATLTVLPYGQRKPTGHPR